MVLDRDRDPPALSWALSLGLGRGQRRHQSNLRADRRGVSAPGSPAPRARRSGPRQRAWCARRMTTNWPGCCPMQHARCRSRPWATRTSRCRCAPRRCRGRARSACAPWLPPGSPAWPPYRASTIASTRSGRTSSTAWPASCAISRKIWTGHRVEFSLRAKEQALELSLLAPAAAGRSALGQLRGGLGRERAGPRGVLAGARGQRRRGFFLGISARAARPPARAAGRAARHRARLSRRAQPARATSARARAVPAHAARARDPRERALAAPGEPTREARRPGWKRSAGSCTACAVTSPSISITLRRSPRRSTTPFSGLNSGG